MIGRIVGVLCIILMSIIWALSHNAATTTIYAVENEFHGETVPLIKSLFNTDYVNVISASDLNDLENKVTNDYTAIGYSGPYKISDKFHKSTAIRYEKLYLVSYGSVKHNSGEKIGYVANYLYGMHADNGIDYGTLKEAVHALVKGEVDYICVNRQRIVDFLSKGNYNTDMFSIVTPHVQVRPIKLFSINPMIQRVTNDPDGYGPRGDYFIIRPLN